MQYSLLPYSVQNGTLPFIYNPSEQIRANVLFRCEVQPSEKEAHWLCGTNLIQTSPLGRNVYEFSVYVKDVRSLHVTENLQQSIMINHLLGVVVCGCLFDYYFVCIFTRPIKISLTYLMTYNIYFRFRWFIPHVNVGPTTKLLFLLVHIHYMHYLPDYFRYYTH